MVVFQSLRFVQLLITLGQIARVSKCCVAMVTVLCSALLFSATFRKKVEKLCRDILTDPVRIVVGTLGEVISFYGYHFVHYIMHAKANTDITQIAMVMADQQSKWTWLLNNLVQLISGM